MDKKCYAIHSIKFLEGNAISHPQEHLHGETGKYRQAHGLNTVTHMYVLFRICI